MNLEQVKKTVEELIADVYPVIMQQSIMDAFLKAPNAADPAYWENIRLGLVHQASVARPQKGANEVNTPCRAD